MRDVDLVVIGAGVVGLAVAAESARRGRSVIVLEQQAGIARGVTSRNSEVVHAGLYYPEASAKAELCVRGREQLYAWCHARGVAHRRLGKLVVATGASEVESLEALHARGLANGAGALELIDGRAVRRLEPDVRAVAALHSPETGIVDAHGLCVSLLAEAEAHAAVLLLRHTVVGLARVSSDWLVEARAPVDDAPTQRVRCGAVIVAAGLDSDGVAALAGLDVDACGLRQHPCKGDYFALEPSARLSLSRLVYPLPGTAGLGIHATLDLGGSIRFGPDAEYVDRIDWTVDPAKAERFAEAVGRYLPTVEPDQLRADYAGIRPKLAGPGEGFRDFVVADQVGAGLPGLVVCAGIESPGLTAALAIADRVADLL